MNGDIQDLRNEFVPGRRIPTADFSVIRKDSYRRTQRTNSVRQSHCFIRTFTNCSSNPGLKQPNIHDTDDVTERKNYLVEDSANQKCSDGDQQSSDEPFIYLHESSNDRIKAENQRDVGDANSELVLEQKDPQSALGEPTSAETALQITVGLPRFEVDKREPQAIRFSTDQGARPLHCAFKNLDWKDFNNRGRWNMFWGNVSNIKNLFQPGQRYYFSDNQLVNHYSTCYHLSRKDNMSKNIKRYRSDLYQAMHPLGTKDDDGNFRYLDLITSTHLLPFDYRNFVKEFKEEGGLWIVKPCNRSQGRGICLINKLSEAKKWQELAVEEVAACAQDNEGYNGYLIAKYIVNPLLIDGKKFDLRLYVLVTSFKPLRCYYYKVGFCRFCATKYDSSRSNIDNKFMHLTNVAVQKRKEGYNRSHGNKWHIRAFRTYMTSIYGRQATDKLFDDIFWLIVQSLKSVQNLMDNERHSYEMYGYDCLIDTNLKPWLLEVNASPSLDDSTSMDRVNKTNLLMDSMLMAMYERTPHLLDINERKADGSDMPLGDYEILHIEEPQPKSDPSTKQTKKVMGRYGPSHGPTYIRSKSGIKEKPRWRS